MLKQEDILQDLKSLIPEDIIKVNEPLKRYTYTETGGNADFYLSPTKNEDVQAIVRYAKEKDIPVTYLGNGSNIIIREGGIRGIVISLLSLNHINVSDDAIIAGSGSAIIDVSRAARDHVLTGLEFACGIPGSVGGAVYMNAGAYGGEIKDCIDYALCVNEEGDLIQFTNKELELDYRNSIVQKQHLVVLEAAFTLEPGKLDEIQAKMDDLTERRESKQPLEYPSCGSVFQRPPGHFAGKLIQDSDLQGYRVGGVEVSKKHAGFMVNVDNGTATDYEDLIHHVQKVVKEKFDVELHREVRIIGEHPKE
ncbi:UDP-N-acetylmuramate dehydrogenase [Staphylococcus sp. EG-SA-6]|jgi:UDP-N-acetylmuramate dehydrogenase|uniref:UDP-N-acetylenolpyruvoylglucosamine reductase n=3 Tax=Bacillales TaxID=1385 RepID=MURB_STAHJ|nr:MULTISPECIES: UDP-N-acetylmuramate dehydrogenase [Staphylococcus]Q4L4G3.1 RecName: Full=UDP-N-acetylenolpyruvoylglucosamine reductase; AltName: Full=UDP-N-acetylmuramate dehydrogenase [Staphylococcus haemolyticus JCSC1435]KDP47399.1 UDP-N-acetylmuramate dehydrogenase [Staphylococcus aureus subsp. aureus CO-98]MBN4934287.1 UDP-N-acetylmuramate dehydrogenase [Staphylococcus sp. EG-SA-6]MDU2096890.1 UDP-N-acetylmuramate dehydrogenase [Staphylococcus sp.]GEU22364.1 UDP-N-acetylenolpyruvoylgluco